jgi:hypothetical protein
MISKPEPGLTVDATVVKVKDGDTIRLRVVYEFDVRLIHLNEEGLEFNAPERNTPAGKKTLEYLKQIEGQVVRLLVPTGRRGNELIDFASFTRVLGIVWTSAGLLTQDLLDKGLASLLKRGTY